MLVCDPEDEQVALWVPCVGKQVVPETTPTTMGLKRQFEIFRRLLIVALAGSDFGHWNRKLIL